MGAVYSHDGVQLSCSYNGVQLTPLPVHPMYPMYGKTPDEFYPYAVITHQTGILYALKGAIRMIFKSMFKHKAKGGIINVIRGITEAEWLNIYEAIKLEYEKTGMTHKKPTEYMRGLAFAMSIMEAQMPHNIAEVQ